MIVILILLILILIFLIVTYKVYKLAFVPDRKKKGNEFVIPQNDDLARRIEKVKAMVKDAETIPYEDVWTTSFDGLRLHARLYVVDESAPIEIFFHGYMSRGMNDSAGGMPYALSKGINALVVTQRAHEGSEGRCLTLGVLESRDVVSWAEYAVERFGKDVRIILCGVSMGGASVMNATAHGLPANVAGIIDDCGYSTPKEMVEVVCRNKHLPVKISWAITKLGARLFGHFDLDDCDGIAAMKQNHIPMLFVHGEADGFVPYEQGRATYEACAAEKKFFSVPGAGHGMSWMTDTDGYKKAVDEFLATVL